MIKRENWLLTVKYLKWLETTGLNITESSIERYEFSLRHLLLWADDLSFEQALNTKQPSFTIYVANLPARRGDGKIAAESQKKIILVSKKFLEWARNNKEIGAKKIIQNRMDNLVHPRIQHSTTDPESISLDEILQIASFDFGDSLVLQRDVAAMCFAFLSGARAGAIVSAPIKAIHLPDMEFYQDTELGVETKNGKSAHTYLLPIPELVAVVKRWDDTVRANSPDSGLWYPPFENHWGEYSFTNKEAGENRGNALIKRFGVIYEKAGMKEVYKSPHKCRHGHAVYGLSRCKNMAEYQAVSRNLMHSSLTITDTIYAVGKDKERKETYSRFVPKLMPVVEGDLVTHLNQICREDRMRAINLLSSNMLD